MIPHAKEMAYEDCNEIWHRHTSLMHGHDETRFVEASTTSRSQKNETCHAGKSVFSYSLFPASVVDEFEPTYGIVFDVISTIENDFRGPDLEPLRKPPKLFV